MTKYSKYESDIYALRYMLDIACQLITKGTKKPTRTLKDDLATEYEDRIKESKRTMLEEKVFLSYIIKSDANKASEIRIKN